MKVYRSVGTILLVGATAVTGALGVIAFIQNIRDDEAKSPATLSYDTIAPHVADFLEKEGALNLDDSINVPNTNGTVDTITIEQSIQALLDSGRFDYLKGATGERGATGANGLQGANGKDGQDALSTITVGSGLAYSGGTISLASCSVDQVLMTNSNSVWTCAHVDSSGIIDTNTTTVNAKLTLSGTNLTHTITDSDGTAISSNTIDLDTKFATNEQLSSAVSSLNISQYVTSGNFDALTARVVTLETAASNYVTSTALSSAISGLASEDWVEDKNYIDSSALSGLATETWITSQNYVSTSTLGGYYTKAQIDSMNLITGTSQSYKLQVVDDLPASPDPGTIYLSTGN